MWSLQKCGKVTENVLSRKCKTKPNWTNWYPHDQLTDNHQQCVERFWRQYICGGSSTHTLITWCTVWIPSGSIHFWSHHIFGSNTDKRAGLQQQGEIKLWRWKEGGEILRTHIWEGKQSLCFRSKYLWQKSSSLEMLVQLKQCFISIPAFKTDINRHQKENGKHSNAWSHASHKEDDYDY